MTEPTIVFMLCWLNIAVMIMCTRKMGDFFCTGVANPVFESHNEWWDILCDVDSGTVKLPTSKQASLLLILLLLLKMTTY